MRPTGSLSLQCQSFGLNVVHFDRGEAREVENSEEDGLESDF